MTSSVRDNPRAMLMLEKYAEWLTGSNKDIGYEWEVEDFFSYKFHGERHDHDETKITSDDLVNEFNRVVVMSVGYADDGGPSVLIGLFWGYEESTLYHLIHSFDSAMQIILQTEY